MFYTIEQYLITLLLRFVSAEQINSFLGDPRHTAILLGVLIAASGGLLGTFLLLRGMALTSDAISHTVLLGIVGAFLVMTYVLKAEPDLDSVWLLIGATAAGVGTVVLTELIYKSGLVRSDAALGLAFPLLFGVAVILVSRFADDVHLDADSVLVGEIGVAWANTNSHCLDRCETVTITPDDPRAIVGRECANCAALGISPRDAKAEFVEICANCGTYTAAQAWRERFIDAPPALVFFPAALTVMGVITLLNGLFVVVLYKELKLATFDSALAAALGFRPQWLHYALMVLVSLTAVGAFDAVGSVLVVAFFIIPPASAYLLTERLSVMILLSPLFGALGAYGGYDLARGSVFGLVQFNWNSSISASMVLMMFAFFLLVWVVSPRYGLVTNALRRFNQRRAFALQMLLGHIQNHQDTPQAAQELSLDSLSQHLNWSEQHTLRVLSQAGGLVRLENGVVYLTERGLQSARAFQARHLQRG